MLESQVTISAVLALLGSTVNGHMIMKTPPPFGNPDNSPLTSANFPCKVTSDPASFYNGVEATKMKIGETQTLSFTGSAVHGGGSCQLAITSEPQPKADTHWQVILSLESGCPSKSGSGADTYDFKIPEGITPGKYVFTWTWQSKLAGQPEYYMNCSPIEVIGGTSKRSDNDSMELIARDVFPDLFVANLADINSCKTNMNPPSDVEYPDPGPNVQRLWATPLLSKPIGDNCYPKGGSKASSAAVAASPPAVSVKPTGAGSSGSTTGAKSGRCSDEGAYFCVGGSQYQQCASGSWSGLQAMPGGTKCKEGESSTLWARDEVRGLRVRRR
ncbi:uncharacterized protein JN550_010929 [Neoarthrinium moseri]|uniref:uncharacterized protein n=1 Tax=Neoarthrinium moseri TaxID=1658444 RepID=UPI001FDB9C3B|nr:uncharacterized protein JN550_010929 [Neoarthrinium moseri]KAI1861399.1 hypothetical protein JN550_010929 [Neoarthrinium moseri]